MQQTETLYEEAMLRHQKKSDLRKAKDEARLDKILSLLDLDRPSSSDPCFYVDFTADRINNSLVLMGEVLYKEKWSTERKDWVKNSFVSRIKETVEKHGAGTVEVLFRNDSQGMIVTVLRRGSAVQDPTEGTTEEAKEPEEQDFTDYALKFAEEIVRAVEKKEGGLRKQILDASDKAGGFVTIHDREIRPCVEGDEAPTFASKKVYTDITIDVLRRRFPELQGFKLDISWYPMDSCTDHLSLHLHLGEKY